MENIKKVRLLFEQSGTFKKEFEKLGYKAYDYDIRNDFNQTFDKQDCIMAFFLALVLRTRAYYY